MSRVEGSTTVMFLIFLHFNEEEVDGTVKGERSDLKTLFFKKGKFQ